MKVKTEVPYVDAFIDDELGEGKKVVKSLLKIPYKPDKPGDKAFRVEDTLYASTRLSTLSKYDEGYEVDVTGKHNLSGKKYELRDAGTAKLLQQGKISAKAAVSNVIDFPKTGTK